MPVKNEKYGHDRGIWGGIIGGIICAVITAPFGLALLGLIVGGIVSYFLTSYYYTQNAPMPPEEARRMWDEFYDDENEQEKDISCPRCGNPGYSRKTIRPEMRCQKCHYEWERYRNDFSPRCPDCGSIGYRCEHRHCPRCGSFGHQCEHRNPSWRGRS